MQTFLYYRSLIRVKVFAGVVNGVVGVVEKHDPVAMGIEPYFTLLKEQQKQLPLLTDPFVGHPLTEPINDDRKRIVELSKAIVNQVRIASNGQVAETKAAAALVAPLIVKYLSKIVRYNSDADTDVSNFLAGIGEYEEMNEAVATVGIRVNVEELRLLKNRLDVNVDKRRVDNAGRRATKDKQLKASIAEALFNTLKAIELAKVKNASVDYTPLISELNELFASYNAIARSRVTRSRNEAIKNETAATSTTTSATAS